MKCGACNGDGRAYSTTIAAGVRRLPEPCPACAGRGTVPTLREKPPDLAPDYPGLTDEDGAMVAFHVRCVDGERE